MLAAGGALVLGECWWWGGDKAAGGGGGGSSFTDEEGSTSLSVSKHHLTSILLQACG